jgi:hypothetical protein
VPTPVGLEHVQLQECTGQFLVFPGSGCFAGTEPNDRVLHAHRLARLHLDVADDTVALVEKRNNGHPLAHRSDVGMLAGTAAALRKLDAIALVLVALLAACREQQRHQRAGNGEASHAQSGVQAW